MFERFDIDAQPAGRDAIHTVTKAVLAGVSLLFLAYLVSLLPGADLLIPSTPVSIAALLGAVLTVVLVLVLLYAAPMAASLTKSLVAGSKAVKENLAAIVYWLIVLAAIIVAHRGLAGAVAPLFGSLDWVYDVIFLLLTLPVVLFIAARLYANIEPGSEHLVDRFFG